MNNNIKQIEREIKSAKIGKAEFMSRLTLAEAEANSELFELWDTIYSFLLNRAVHKSLLTRYVNGNILKI